MKQINQIILDTITDNNYYLVLFNDTKLQINKSVNTLDTVINYLSSQCTNLIIK